jgi:hypothetical protein
MKKRNFNTKAALILESKGYVCVNVETWNAHAGVKNDLLGFADLLAFIPTMADVVLVQITSTENKQARFNKIINSVEAYAWVCSNPMRQIMLLTFDKYNHHKIEWIREDDFPKKSKELKLKLFATRTELAKLKLEEME